MYFLVLDPDTSDPNPHAWEVNDAGPFETYGEACGFAQQEEGELQEEYETDDVVPACILCNRAKADLTIEEFRAWLRRASSITLKGGRRGSSVASRGQ